MKNYILFMALGLAVDGGIQAEPFLKPALTLQHIGDHKTGDFNQSAAEIVAYDAKYQQIFKVNAKASTVDVLDLKDPSHPILITSINASEFGGSANSVAVHDGLMAVAIEALNKQDPGVVAFYDANSFALLNSVSVGALPDMVTFTPNGRYVLVANEGEPNADYTNDPEGSISVIDLRHGVNKAVVKTAGFEGYIGKEDELRAAGVRLIGPNKDNAAKDLEPEYITVSNDSSFAWVSLQEANALAKIDIERAEVVAIEPLGFKDHSLEVNALDASDKDGGINIRSWPVKGMYMPDSIASYTFQGKTYIVTANEGDSRDYGGFSDEVRVKDLNLDPTAFPDAYFLQQDENLGRLKTTIANGDIDGDGDFDEIYSFGARSFSIRDADGGLVYDSGADFEKITADELSDNFNSNHGENGSFDSRSDDKGPEPEGIALGEIMGHTFAFIGLERVGGVMVYDVTDPYHVGFVDYINHRDFTVTTQEADGSVNPLVGDLGPEGLTFISAHQSPNHIPLLVVGNEVSGTTSVFEIHVNFPGTSAH